MIRTSVQQKVIALLCHKYMGFCPQVTLKCLHWEVKQHARKTTTVQQLYDSTEEYYNRACVCFHFIVRLFKGATYLCFRPIMYISVKKMKLQTRQRDGVSFIRLFPSPTAPFNFLRNPGQSRVHQGGLPGDPASARRALLGGARGLLYVWGHAKMSSGLHQDQ